MPTHESHQNPSPELPRTHSGTNAGPGNGSHSPRPMGTASPAEAFSRSQPHTDQTAPANWEAELQEMSRQLLPAAPALAKLLQRVGTTVYERCGVSGFAAWHRAWQRLQTVRGVPRAGVEAFLRASRRVREPDVLACWVAPAALLAGHAPQLAAEYLVATAPLVPGRSAEFWQAIGQTIRERLHGDGWKAELATRALVQALPRAVCRLDATCVALWAEVGRSFSRIERVREFFTTEIPLPKPWEPATRRRFLNSLLQPGLLEDWVWALYRDFPRGAHRLDRFATRRLVNVLSASLSAAPQGWVEVAPVAGAILGALPRRLRSDALDALERVAGEVPAAVPALLRSLPHAYERAPRERVAGWVHTGLLLCGGDRAQAWAYFALETRTSVRVLEASPTAAVFAEAQPWLRKFAHMLAASPVTLRSRAGFTLRPPLEGLFDELVAEVPDRIDFFPTHEDNVGLYRFLVMQIAGRFAWGTAPHAPAEWPQWKDGLECSADRPQLYDWFLFAEGVRIGAQMAAQFAGWREEQKRVLARVCHHARRVDELHQPAVYDWLLAWELAGLPTESLPEPLASIAPIVRALATPLHAETATVDDSWAVANTLERTFRALHNVAETDASAGETPGCLIPVDLYDGDAPPQNSLPAESPTPGWQEPVPALQGTITEENEHGSSGAPLSPETMEAFLRSGVELQLRQGDSRSIDGLGLYVSDLLGKLPAEQLVELRSLLDEGDAPARARRWLAPAAAGAAYYYDEWDYLLNDYRHAWCRLIEMPVDSDGGEFFHRTLTEYESLLPVVRREFQKIRPDSYTRVRGLEAGDDFDLNAVVDARSDRRARQAPSSKLYVARRREERDVAVLFLIDLSASTDEPVPSANGRHHRGAGHDPRQTARRIIDITKEALVIMAEALEELGDTYAIYGFSGHGRQQVEFYTVKSFQERLSAAVRGRIGALEPKRSTRMGAALRHAMAKIAPVSARSRHILLLSDGFPQDFDYGQDRRSNTYGLRDTTVALQECEARGIVPFCITVDRAGHDYLREMCPQSRYLVIDDISSLPGELPKIYQRVVAVK